MQNLLIAFVGIVLLCIGFSMVTNFQAVAAGHQQLTQSLRQGK